MDKQHTKGMRDASRIDLDDPYEILHWTKRFGVTEQELRDVVARVGILVDNVEKEFSNPR